MQKTARAISAATKAEVIAITADASKAEDNRRMVDETVKRFGTIHVLVNNAGGVGAFAAFHDLTDDDWLDIFNLNVLSAVRATRAALPHMQKQKWGRIINISSESGTQPDGFMPHYNASKAAMNNLTKSLSKAYATEGILVNTVSPAFIMTPLLSSMLQKLAAEQGVSAGRGDCGISGEEPPAHRAEASGRERGGRFGGSIPRVGAGFVYQWYESACGWWIGGELVVVASSEPSA